MEITSSKRGPQLIPPRGLPTTWASTIRGSGGILLNPNGTQARIEGISRGGIKASKCQVFTASTVVRISLIC